MLAKLTRPLFTVAILAVAFTVGSGASEADAHSSGPQFISYTSGTSAHLAGVRITLVSTGSAPYVSVSVPPGHLLEIKGLAGEPFVRVTSSGASVNSRSASRFLIYGANKRAAIRAQDNSVPPRWMRLATKPPFGYYEPRAEWPLTRPPAAAQSAGRRWPIFHWEVPALYDGSPIKIQGYVDWLPPPPNFEVILLGAAFVVFAFFGLEKKARPHVVGIARLLALMVAAGIALDAARTTGEALGSSRLGWVGPLALIPALALVALAAAKIWRLDRRAYSSALAFGAYLVLFGLARNGPSGLPFIALSFGPAEATVGGLLIFGGGILTLVSRSAPSVS